jgi:hypothetical protein
MLPARVIESIVTFFFKNVHPCTYPRFQVVISDVVFSTIMILMSYSVSGGWPADVFLKY